MFGYPGIDLQDKCWILLAKYNLKMLILTCGVNGSYVFTPGEISFVETPKVEVADTVGAGDSFTATFVAAVLKGKSVAEAHKLAVEVSAYVEPELLKAKGYDSYQFVRNGFYCADIHDSKEGAPVFNRIVSLKSSFKLPKA